ncbi:unnamed protein product [Pieris brassicae]|uniref:PiggyBac transposable element-derived protein domain-containing protein n=1 Tax=Pieris brassicae TaxID=7116 RepID=A0A9P0TMF7_PIEBR|nr:unnamed protein product [Pieris brassicae]
MFIYDKSPIELEAYSETKNEFVELNTLNANIDVDKELCDNLNKIRTGHMNEEEKREITRLCYRYRDIFHSENVPLTFTHAVKHQLRLSNDTPIYVRSYRQAPQQRAEIRNQFDNLLKQVNLDDNEDNELIGRIFENVRITQQNDRQTDDEPMAGPSRQDDNLDPDVQLDPQSPSIAESAIDKNQLSEVELVSTNNTQPDNENNGIPILSDAIDRQLKQFHIRSTPGTTYRVEDRSTNRRTVIKDVFIPVNNTEQEIIRFLKEHTIADRIFHCYFYNDELYPKFCKVYCTTFNNRGPKLIRCTTRVTLVENKNEQEALIRKYHEAVIVYFASNIEESEGEDDTMDDFMADVGEAVQDETYNVESMRQIVNDLRSEIIQVEEVQGNLGGGDGPTQISPDPVDSLEYFFGGDIINTTVEETNRYAQMLEIAAEHRVPPKNLMQWTETDAPEIYRLLAIIMLVTLSYRPKVKDYWTTGLLEMFKS